MVNERIIKEEDEREFKTLYYIEEMTKKELAEYYDVSLPTIYNTFDRFNMKTMEHEKYEPSPESIKKARENLPDDVRKKTWELSEEGRKAIQKTMQRIHTKHGLYADIPIICHGEDCPYSETCELYNSGEAPEGEKCPVEIATIIQLTKDYCDEFNVERNDTTNISLIRDLVNAEVSIRRADKLISIEGDPIDQVTVGITDDGRAIRRPEISKPYELKEKLLKRKHRIMTKLNATPKDKAQTEESKNKDFSSYMADMYEKMQKYDNNNNEPEVIEIVQDDDEK